eukprot:1161341-Pelagomonas_calceolata.AAC.19
MVPGKKILPSDRLEDTCKQRGHQDSFGAPPGPKRSFPLGALVTPADASLLRKRHAGAFTRSIHCVLVTPNCAGQREDSDKDEEAWLLGLSEEQLLEMADKEYQGSKSSSS